MDELSDAGFAAAATALAMGAAGEAAADRALFVRFYMDVVEDHERTKKEGHPCFKSVEFVSIHVPGSRDVRKGPVTKVHPDPRIRFADRYARFKAGEQVQIVGQPLSKWGLLAPERVKEYEYQGVYSVEQLAALSDTSAQSVRGSIADRQTAKDFLEMAKGRAPLAAARAEADDLRSQLEALREQVSAMEGGTGPRRRGRPPGSKNKPKDPEPEA